MDVRLAFENSTRPCRLHVVRVKIIDSNRKGVIPNEARSRLIEPLRKYVLKSPKEIYLLISPTSKDLRVVYIVFLSMIKYSSGYE